MSVKLQVVKKIVAGAEHECVCVMKESRNALYSVEVMTIGEMIRVDGLAVAEFPNTPATNALRIAFEAVAPMIEEYLLEASAIRKDTMLQSMNTKVASVR